MHGHEVSDRFLRDLWAQVARLREHRIAHRDLRRANVLVDGDGEPWLTGFAFSEVAASDDQIDGDVAQLLAALSLTVGAERSVTSAVETLGPHTVGTALARLQPNALSDSTRAELEERPGPARGAPGHRRATVRGQRAELCPARADQPATPLHRGDARGGHLFPPAATGRPAGRLPRDRCGRLGLGSARRAVLGLDLRRRRARHGRRGARRACAPSRHCWRRSPPRSRATSRPRASAAWHSTCGTCRSRASMLRWRRRAWGSTRWPASPCTSCSCSCSSPGPEGPVSARSPCPSWSVVAIGVARRRGVRRDGHRDPGHPQAARHEARARARQRVAVALPR